MVRTFFLFIFAGLSLWGQTSSLANKTATMKKYDGYIPYYWDEKSGKIFLEVERWDNDFIYIVGLSHGVGSNDIGLDRGQIGGSRLVRFTRVGPKVLLIESNTYYRANSDDPRERQAVRESFAESILWGFTVDAEEGRRVLVDATSFFMRDAHDVAGSLKSTQQGNYQVDASRSAMYMERTKNFPRNSEFDAVLTFTGGPAGEWLRSVTPSPDAVTVHQHHSFVQLPDPGYQPRWHDPRAGMIWVEFHDYATPIAEPIKKRWITRHRLEKKNPAAEKSEAVKPIVYYVDGGTPEPIRSALLEGASWWNEAFESAGFINAFQVKVLPDTADPMDVRYNVIQWVHRSTRGWSYGNPITDPRTGEIIKGHVSLGSLRVRQDYLIATGLLAPFEEGKPAPKAMEAMALARLQQLSAHEVGHTLGFQHNFAASVSERASVMDYPHPLISFTPEGKISLDNAYATGIGAWDKATVRFAYATFKDAASEKEGLRAIIDQSRKQGLTYITDTDARPRGTAHPTAHLWDNGTNAADELLRIMKIRAKALGNFSDRVIRVGEPNSTIEEVLVPIYLLHRYQTDAAAKIIGGLHYEYTLRGDGSVPAYPATDQEQERALSAVLSTIETSALTLPEHIIKIIPPRADGYDMHRELFPRRTGIMLDPLTIAETAAEHTISGLLHPQRMNRLLEQKRREVSKIDAAAVLDSLINRTIKKQVTNTAEAEVQRTINYVALYQLFYLANSGEAQPQIQAITRSKINALGQWVANQKTTGAWKIHYEEVARLIREFNDEPKSFVLPYKPKPAPPGAPIGSCDFE
ncbi:zinc-dependent metalloprotease [bacterium]|nr:zinc-dependent metalloprotease [bacterium]